MDVAVVIPVYNRQETLPRALASVAGQSVLPARLIVVDDGSTDSTFEVVKRWQRVTQPPFEMHIVRQPNQGCGAARNGGLAVAGDAPLISFLDSDDVWPTDFLQRTTAAMIHCPNAVAVSTDSVVFSASGIVLQTHDVRPVSDDATWWFFNRGTALTSCTLFRTEVIRKLGGYRGELRTGEDIALGLRLSVLGPWLHAPGAAVEYRTAMAGDEGHLCQVYDESEMLWAELRAEFLDNYFGGINRAGNPYRRSLAHIWYLAGRELLHRGLVAQARACFWRAIQLRPLRHKAWIKLAASLIR